MILFLFNLTIDSHFHYHVILHAVSSKSSLKNSKQFTTETTKMSSVTRNVSRGEVGIRWQPISVLPQSNPIN